MRTTPLLLLLALTALGVALLPGPRPASAAGAVAIAAGGDHACVLTSAGDVKCSGYNLFGALGDGQACGAVCTTPVDVAGLEGGVAALAGGRNHTCALTAAGGVKCWGLGHRGQLGAEEIGSCVDPFGRPTGSCNATPVDVVGLESGVVAVIAGYNHTCAITAEGGLKCWGWNAMGQLGDGTTTTRWTPVDVCEVYDHLAGQCLQPLSDVSAVAGGYEHTCALTDDGGLKCWGSNIYGGLGAEANESCDDPFLGFPIACSTSPLDVVGLESGVAAVTAAAVHTCALSNAGGAKCWGLNDRAQLGTETDEFCLDPVFQEPSACSTVPLDVLGLASGVAAVAAGGHHTCALTSDGGLKCWGLNFHGELGDGTPSERPETLIVRTTPVDVCRVYDDVAEECLRPLSGVAAVDAGGNYTCAVTRVGSLKCWGGNCCGQLGIGSSDFDPHPIPLDAFGLSPKTEPGDADCSGHVSSIDALLVLQYGAGLIPELPCREAADVNQDGGVNSLDATLILQYVAGLIDSL